MATLQPAEPAGARFSISDAALEGFTAIRTHWRVVAGWSLFNLVALVGGCILLVIALVGVAPFVASREAAGAAGSLIGALVFGLGGLMVQVVILTGVYRLELRPEEPGFLHLRIGRDEFRVLGALLLLALAAIPLVLAGGLVMYALGRVSEALAVVAGIALLLAFYAAILRLALALPIAFAEHRISLVEAWRRTRGQTWRLLGMAVLLLCLLGFIGVAMWIGVFVLGGVLTGFQDLGFSDAETAAAHPGRFLFEVAAEMLLAPVFIVLSQSPSVAVYRALKP